jgi:two-component system, OmpR family, sensor kinase
MGRLFWKIFFGFWLTLLITGLAVGALVWQQNRERIEQLEVLVDSPRAEMGLNSAATILRLEGASALKEVLQDRALHRQRPSRLLVVNDAGIDLLGRRIPDALLSKAREQSKDHEESATRQVTTPEGEHFLLFIPRHDHSDMHTPGMLPKQQPLLPTLIILIGSLFFSAALAWYITRPIRFLREATNRFAEGELDTRVMPSIGKRKDEITDLAKDFDHMAEQVQLLVTAQKRLLNDVSHELRSPLARIQVAIEIGRQQPQKINEFMQRVEKESQRLDELVGELLTLSRLETGVVDDRTENDYFDINGLVGSIANDARFEAESLSKQVIYNNDKEVLVYGNMELLRRAIENVVRNAMFYTPVNSSVEIGLVHKDKQIEITVCDKGQGVSEEKLNQLFIPFVRINDNRQNVKIPGYGLGLAIARRAVEIHKGHISAYNRKEGGLCIKMCLPG